MRDGPIGPSVCGITQGPESRLSLRERAPSAGRTCLKATGPGFASPETSEGVWSPSYAESLGILAPKGLDSIAQGAQPWEDMAPSIDQGPTGRHPVAESSDGPLGLEEDLASNLPGLRPGLSGQAPLGPRRENLRTIATTLLPKSRKTSEVGRVGFHWPLAQPRPMFGSRSLRRRPFAE